MSKTEGSSARQLGYEAEPTGSDGQYIRDQLLPEFWGRFAEKAADYNDNGNENHRQLGVRGQFADIWRKIGKLKKALWEGRQLVGEQPREILMDLIAHCFLTIAVIDGDNPIGPVDMTSEEFAQAYRQAAAQMPSRVMVAANEDRLWPSCGRERCVAHAMVPLSELRAAGVVKIQPGEPKDGQVLQEPVTSMATRTTLTGMYCHG